MEKLTKNLIFLIYLLVIL